MKQYLYKDLYLLEDKHWWHLSKRRIVSILIKKYNEVDKPKILDIGCGTGKNMEEFQKFGSVYGLDNSIQALEFCKQRGLKNLKLGNAEKMHLKSDYFDIVTLLDVLEHTEDIKVLNETYKALKKDGLIIIIVPAFSWLWSKWDEVLHHKRRYTSASLQKILISAGFQPIKVTYLYSFLLLPALLIRGIKSYLFKDSYPSDFRLSNLLINLLMTIFAKIEFFIADRFPIPFGTSILIVAKK